MHTARDPDRDRDGDWERWFLCYAFTVHTTQGQGTGPGTNLVPYPFSRSLSMSHPVCVNHQTHTFEGGRLFEFEVKIEDTTVILQFGQDNSGTVHKI